MSTQKIQLTPQSTLLNRKTPSHHSDHKLSVHAANIYLPTLSNIDGFLKVGLFDPAYNRTQ